MIPGKGCEKVRVVPRTWEMMEESWTNEDGRRMMWIYLRHVSSPCMVSEAE